MMKQENTPFGGWLKRKLLLICIKSKKVRTRTRHFSISKQKGNVFLEPSGESTYIYFTH